MLTAAVSWACRTLLAHLQRHLRTRSALSPRQQRGGKKASAKRLLLDRNGGEVGVGGRVRFSWFGDLNEDGEVPTYDGAVPEMDHDNGIFTINYDDGDIRHYRYKFGVDMERI